MSADATNVQPSSFRALKRSTVSRKSSLVMPERLKTGDDADLDVTAPKTRRGQLLNQSFLSLIATVGHVKSTRKGPSLSQIPFAPDPSYPDRPHRRRSLSPRARQQVALHNSSERTTRRLQQVTQDAEDLTQSTPGLLQQHKQRSRASLLAEHMSSSQFLPPRQSVDGTCRSEDSTDDHETTGSLHAHMEEELDQEEPAGEVAEQQGPILAQTIARIFDLKEPEEVIAEYQCAFLQNVVLQGYLYITQKHVCFYAYLPKQSSQVLKSGWLYKRGRRNPTYNKYWFELKGDILTYANDPKDRYFIRGNIHMPGALSAELIPSKKGDDTVSFVINTAHERYQFRAESATSAEQWVKQLQKVIFRCQNDGDSVKIWLPIDNLLDVEEKPFFGPDTTITMKVLDNRETFTVAEYYFSFSKVGQSVLTVLKDKIKTNKAMQDVQNFAAQALADSSALDDAPDSPRMPGSGKDRPTVERKSTFEKSRPVGKSSESQRPSIDLEQNSDTRRPSDQVSQTASQMLQGDDLFKRPTIRPDRRASQFKPISTPSEDSPSASQLEAQQYGRHINDLRERSSKEAMRPSSSASQEKTLKTSASTTSLQGYLKAGASSLSKASGLAQFVRSNTSTIASLFATQSKTTYEKVAGMYAGRSTHYNESEGPIPDEMARVDDDDEAGGSKSGDSFRAHFSLPESEKLQAAFYAFLGSTFNIYGKMYIGDTKLCFRSLMPGMRKKMILPLKDIENVNPDSTSTFGYSGLCLVVRGHEEVFFEFRSLEIREDCRITILKALDGNKHLAESKSYTLAEKLDAQVAKAEFDSLSESYKNSPRIKSAYMERMSRSEDGGEPIMFDDMEASIVTFDPPKGQRVVCLTIGSRGDVQPYVALCKGLQKEGHRPKIATHMEFKGFVESHGIDFVPVAGDPAEIMRLCVEHDMFTVSFFREALSKFTGWVDELLESAWEACQDADILIESPSAMAGIHIAEALRVPYFRAFTMPWTKTRAYPHAFTVPTEKKGGTYNSLSYQVFDTIFWAPLSPQVNRWRHKRLGLKPTSLQRMQQNKVPFLYNFSPSVVAPPLDFAHWVHITGYWFLDEAETYTPPTDLANFLAQARSDNKKIVYIGFGSITVEDPTALTETIIKAIQKADVRCVLSKGWSDKLQKDSPNSEVDLPPEIHRITQAPHDWLFRQVDAAVHHGGAGTTGASLRAGIPTIIKPFFGDQYFFGSRVSDLGVGFSLNGLNTTNLSQAIYYATRDHRMMTKARILGEKIQSENGVRTAIQTIYRDLEYARDLVEQRSKQTQKAAKAAESPQDEGWDMIEDDDIDRDDIDDTAQTSV